jgi:septal ring factor EnvC (AmiA/AmiB activator)
MTIPTDIHVLAAIGLVVCILFFLAGGVNQVLKLTDRNKPQPPLHEAYASREQCERLMQANTTRHSQIFAEIKTVREQSEGEARKLGEKLSEEIGEVKTAVGILNERTKTTNESVKAMGQDLSDVREAVASLTEKH